MQIAAQAQSMKRELSEREVEQYRGRRCVHFLQPDLEDNHILGGRFKGKVSCSLFHEATKLKQNTVINRCVCAVCCVCVMCVCARALVMCCFMQDHHCGSFCLVVSKCSCCPQSANKKPNGIYFLFIYLFKPSLTGCCVKKIK